MEPGVDNGGNGPPDGWWEASNGLYYPPDEEPGAPATGSDATTPEVSPRTLRRFGWAGAFGGAFVVVALGVFAVFLRDGSAGPIEPGMVARGGTFALDIAQCPDAAGGVASGSIRNDTEQVVSFRIEIPLVDSSGSDVSVESAVVEELRPLEASRWETGPAPSGTVDCAGDRNQVFYDQIRPVQPGG